MHVTEKEAKQLACYQRNQGVCLASRCMAWRWVDWEYEDTRSEIQPGPDWKAGEYVNQWFRPHPDRRGRCGMAGE
jgi:hypothetical protein